MANQMFVEQSRRHHEEHLPNQTKEMKADGTFERHLNRLAQQAAETMETWAPVLGEDGAREMVRAELFPAPGEMEDEEEEEVDPRVRILNQAVEDRNRIMQEDQED